MKRVMLLLLRMVLPACVVVLCGVLVLYGVRGLLPDYTGEIHAYSAVEQQLLPVPEESEELTLYPWKELTVTPGEKTSELPELESFLWGLLEAFGIPYSSVDFEKAELLCDESYTAFGVKNVTVYVYAAENEEAADKAVMITAASEARLSFAVSGETLCFFRIEQAVQTSADGDVKNGYVTLCEQANDPFATDTPFARFLSHYYTACEWFGFAYGLDIFLSLLESGKYTSFLYENEAYFSYMSEYGSLTLICDPLTLSVTGFSLESVGGD